MNEHFVVTLDRGHLRIYAEQHEPGRAAARLQVVEAMDFPVEIEGYVEHETDAAVHTDVLLRTAATASRIQQLQREQLRRHIQLLATEINTFLQYRPSATWDFAAPAPVYEAIIDGLAPDAIDRLQRSLSMDLVNQNAEEVRVQFAASAV